MQDASEIWTKVSAVLKETKEISSLAYTTWLASIKTALFRSDCLIWLCLLRCTAIILWATAIIRYI